MQLTTTSLTLYFGFKVVCIPRTSSIDEPLTLHASGVVEEAWEVSPT